MLSQLWIENFLLIGELTVPFGQGFNVLTGETGTGKSMVLEALELVLGGRGSGDVVREGEHAARLLALFCDHSGQETVVERDIDASGHSRFRLDHRPVTAAEIRSLRSSWIDLVGQGSAFNLKQPALQVALLDRFGGNEALLRQIAGVEGELRRLSAELSAMGGSERERNRRLDILRYEVDEIRSAGLEAGEEESLQRHSERLRRSGELVAALQRAHTLLRDERGAEDALGEAIAALSRVEGLEPDVDAACRLLLDAQAMAQEAAMSLAATAGSSEFNPQELETVEERQRLLLNLKRKYGTSIDEVLAYAEQAEHDIDTLAHAEDEMKAIEAHISDQRAQLSRLGGSLRTERQHAAARLQEALADSLPPLGLPGDALRIDSGGDGPVLLFAPNPGVSPRPLQEVASGGELSRLLLAVSLCQGRGDDVSILLDEIDQGLGGATARKVGGALQRLGQLRQVIAVTHQAAVAAQADHHIGMIKASNGDRTSIRAQVLSGEERVAELARMLSGDAGSASIAHAREMLQGS